MNIGDVIFQLISFCSRIFPVCRDIRIQKLEQAPHTIGQNRKETRRAARRKKRKVIVHSEAGATSSTFIRSGSSVYTA